MSTSADLKGKVVLVTGAGSGIGRAAAELLHAAEARLVLIDKDEAALDSGSSALAGRKEDLMTAVADISDDAQIESVVAAALDRYGRLDCAFNNAGIGVADLPTAELPVSEWQRALNVNLTGTFICMRHEIQAMLQGDGGAIVNTASALGLVGMATQSAYAAAKHGIVGLTKSASLEYSSQGIRINAICPGLVDTPMTRGEQQDPDMDFAEVVSAIQPVGRLATPGEIAAAALFLFSDAASFVHGAALPVDGGYSAH